MREDAQEKAALESDVSDAGEKKASGPGVEKPANAGPDEKKKVAVSYDYSSSDADEGKQSGYWSASDSSGRTSADV